MKNPHENPCKIPSKSGIFYGYVSFREGNMLQNPYKWPHYKMGLPGVISPYFIVKISWKYLGCWIGPMDPVVPPKKIREFSPPKL